MNISIILYNRLTSRHCIIVFKIFQYISKKKFLTWRFEVHSLIFVIFRRSILLVENTMHQCIYPQAPSSSRRFSLISESIFNNSELADIFWSLKKIYNITVTAINIFSLPLNVQTNNINPELSFGRPPCLQISVTDSQHYRNVGSIAGTSF